VPGGSGGVPPASGGVGEEASGAGCAADGAAGFRKQKYQTPVARAAVAKAPPATRAAVPQPEPGGGTAAGSSPLDPGGCGELNAVRSREGRREPTGVPSGEVGSDGEGEEVTEEPGEPGEAGREAGVEPLPKEEGEGVRLTGEGGSGTCSGRTVAGITLGSHPRLGETGLKPPSWVGEGSSMVSPRRADGAGRRVPPTCGGELTLGSQLERRDASP